MLGDERGERRRKAKLVQRGVRDVVMKFAKSTSETREMRWIAERELVRRDVVGGRVIVRLGCPEPDPESPHGRDWRCSFAIEGLGDNSIHYGHGLDSISALQNALRIIRLVLLRSKIPLRRELTKTNDIGFPMAAPVAYGIRFQRKLERYMEAEVKKRGREARRKAQKKQ
ncbi:MAG: hypothetical protein IPM54_19020 [Polyangiaceae bacterium]|nr:hypothetical protein [Polyangiaceae bacterium]